MSIYFHVLDPLAATACTAQDALSYCWCFWAARNLHCSIALKDSDVVAYTLRELYTSTNFLKHDPANDARNSVASSLDELYKALVASPLQPVVQQPKAPPALAAPTRTQKARRA